MLDNDMTHQEIADHLTRQFGRPVTRASVTSAIRRANLPKRNPRYQEEIPWRVRQEHLTHYAARMLRLLGRRRAGQLDDDDLNARLDGWLAQLREDHAVVTYVPDTDEGFFYVDGDFDGELPVLRELQF